MCERKNESVLSTVCFNGRLIALTMAMAKMVKIKVVLFDMTMVII
jgi:hypothetical protein